VEFVPIAPPAPARFFPSSPSESAPDPDADRRRQLQTLASEVAKCDRCSGLFSTRTQTVFGGGPVSPDILFVGDAPCADDDRDGQPFRGEAGALLDKILGAMGLSRAEVYLTTAIKCRPPRNRPPTADECGNCRGYLDRQLELIRPRAICCLGETAARTLLGVSGGIRTLRGPTHEHAGTPVVCTYHPQEVVQNAALKRPVWDDMLRLLTLLGRTPPAKAGS
ncbi:MAG: uracil-DNA glycosylase, partial [Gemmataceae bacterium]